MCIFSTIGSTQSRERVRGFIQAMIESDLDETLQRPRYKRPTLTPDGVPVTGDGRRDLGLVPRARLQAANGKTTEWRSNIFAGLSAPHAGRRSGDWQKFLATGLAERQRFEIVLRSPHAKSIA
jgi:hypothetical protein